ncbi:MAG: tetratricopeptide repeat protein [Spirochaetales bacterium]|nr:tetratricopeptide repeat protein [Spirochaetales bacterium]
MNRKLLIVSALLLFSFLAWGQSRPDALREYRLGNLDKAIEICLLELEDSPGNMDSYTVLCWSLIKQGDYQKALEYSEEGLSHNYNDIRVLEIAGEANYYLGKNLDALKHFERYCVLAPTGDRIELVYFFMGEIFIRLGEYNHADIAFTTAVYHSPNSAKWWARLGYAREMAEDYRFALEAYDKSLTLNPSSTESLRGRERVEQKMGNG